MILFNYVRTEEPSKWKCVRSFWCWVDSDSCGHSNFTQTVCVHILGNLGIKKGKKQFLVLGLVKKWYFAPVLNFKVHPSTTPSMFYKGWFIRVSYYAYAKF